MATGKHTYIITVRDSQGHDSEVTVKGTKAAQDDSGRLVILDGEEQVFGGISIVQWRKAEA